MDDEYSRIREILDPRPWARGQRRPILEPMSIVSFPADGGARLTRRRLARVAEARDRLSSTRERVSANGRAWINGREVGGENRRFAHLAHSHD
jgi:hypothetical protein